MLDLYDLPFAKIILLRKDLAEVIVNEGVEIDVAMVGQFHEFLLSHLRTPFSLLINKIHSYTYDFDAQLKLGALDELKAIAVIAYTRMTKLTTETVADLPRDIKWNLKIFSNRDEALAWLDSQ